MRAHLPRSCSGRGGPPSAAATARGSEHRFERAGVKPQAAMRPARVRITTYTARPGRLSQAPHDETSTAASTTVLTGACWPSSVKPTHVVASQPSSSAPGRRLAPAAERGYQAPVDGGPGDLVGEQTDLAPAGRTVASPETDVRTTVRTPVRTTVRPSLRTSARTAVRTERSYAFVRVRAAQRALSKRSATSTSPYGGEW